MKAQPVPESWIPRVAEAIAATVREFAPQLADESIVRFAVDCHPWHGMVGLAILTAQEVKEDRELASPEEMAEWRYYDFATELESATLMIPLGQEMRSAYEQADDRPKTAVAFLKACAAAVTSPEVTTALKLLKRAKGFRVSVTHPDSNREYVARK